MIKLTTDIIKSYAPCYCPTKYIPKDWSGSLVDILKMEEVSKLNRLWVARHAMDDKGNRLFAVWCAREALKLIPNPDPRSVEACNVAERFANGEATKEELKVAKGAAYAYVANAAAYANAANAAYAAYAAAAYAADATASYAAKAAAYAADATASYAAKAAAGATASYAADAAADVAAYAADAAARNKARQEQINRLIVYLTEES